MKLGRLIGFFSIVTVILTPTLKANTMVALSEQEMSDIQGQALLTLSTTDGNSPVDGNVTRFFKLGAEAVIDINANIKKLQLGCGGINGADGCDIDIDNLALSGLPRNADGSINTNYTAQDRAGSSAKITNPFIEFAIKNPDSLATREMVGFRLSAEAIQGLLTLGTENSNTPNGINSFSGYIKTKEASGNARTAARNMTYADTNLPISGVVQGRLFGSSSGQTCVDGFLDPCYNIAYNSTDYNLALTSTNAPYTIGSTIISGTRIANNSIVLKGSGTVEQIDFSGNFTATVAGFLNLDKEVTGNITGLKTDITVTQNLGLIHALYLQNPASLSLQKEKVLYPGAAQAAERGWWLSIEDQLDLGTLDLLDDVQISNQVLQQTIAGITQDLTNNPRNCGNLLTGCVGGSTLTIGNIPFSNTVLDFPLKDVRLKGQDFQPNCYGNLRFC